jgi:hypothetical protein
MSDHPGLPRRLFTGAGLLAFYPRSDAMGRSSHQNYAPCHYEIDVLLVAR